MILKSVMTLAFIATFAYLFFFFKFMVAFRRTYEEIWRKIGSPEFFGSSGQAKFLSIVLGMEKEVASDKISQVRTELFATRISLATGMACYLIVIFFSP